MNDTDRKLLTKEVLGECWHTDEEIRNCSVGTMRLPCKKCGKQGYNRTFTAWQDLGDLMEKVVEMGKWEKFYHWVETQYFTTHPSVIENNFFISWLFINPTRFCQLVADWWKEKHINALRGGR